MTWPGSRPQGKNPPPPDPFEPRLPKETKPPLKDTKPLGPDWIVKTIAGWFLLGIVLGSAFGLPIVALSSVANACDPNDFCEGMGYALAMVLVPIIGAMWGILAGLIGGLIGYRTRSRIGYASTMTVLAVIPLTVAAVFYVWGLFVWALLVALAAGLVVWWVSWKMSRRLSVSAISALTDLTEQ